MNKRNLKLMLLLGIVIGNGVVFSKEESKATIGRKTIASIMNSVSNLTKRAPRSKSDPTGLKAPNVSLMEKNVLEPSSGLTLGTKSKLGDEDSNVGAIRPKNIQLRGMHSTYGANIDDFEDPGYEIQTSNWYLQHYSAENKEETVVSKTRPKVLMSIEGTEIDKYVDEQGNEQKIVHYGAGNWLSGSVVKEKLEHEKITQLIEKTNNLEGIDIPETVGIDRKDVLYAKIHYLNKFGTSKSDEGALRNKPLKTDILHGKRIKDFDADKVESINTNWWYLQFEDSDGQIKTLVSTERPIVKTNKKGQEVEHYKDSVSGDDKSLKPGLVGLWYSGQKILENIRD